ncbi:MAG: hypothetical protein HOV68_26895 [Streptomycetaceae bacterium]|nr:hypothetical protein [Streptomycetaceae bacterium]
MVRLEVRRGRFAELGTQYPEGKISEARPQIAAAYVANCASGRVSYRLDIKTPGQFPDPQAMLRTVVAANAERDGCALPQ